MLGKQNDLILLVFNFFWNKNIAKFNKSKLSKNTVLKCWKFY